jgi:cobalt-zinc-cadmium efflux system outer membrane protein
MRQNAYAKSICPVPSRLEELVTCLLEAHPDSQRSNLDVELSRLTVDIAKQRPNPEFESQTLGGGAFSQGQFQQALRLLHTVELGGKRSARQSVAEGQIAVTESTRVEVKASILRSLLITLHHIRIKERELHAVEESQTTFQKLIKQYKDRPHKSAEQDVALNVFRLAAQDYELRRSQILDVQAGFARVFRTIAGLELSELASILPEAPKSWDKLPESEPSVDAAPEINTLLASQLLQQGEYNLAKSLSYPDLKIGPAYQYVWDPTYVSNSFGLTFTLPLPIYQTNAAGRAFALKAVEIAEQKVFIKRRELHGERAQLVSVYRDTTQALEAAQSLQSIEEKHSKIESLFLQGLVSSALIIEAHRQLVETIQITGERELRAIEAKIRIDEIDGRLLEGYLK